ncbi:hypothetical protein FA15DRAFT_660997 [Coprinopsis marcescibilis]|uniref:Uncharacterized protein n=1 Tax=Coprinopsis marcescibilis TaxID=230819 RepID=A0A5C3KDW3_COPMA|nr:hypothetical protein FA15DRAFT_660997 [Coprinopsis marcescibilis]
MSTGRSSKDSLLLFRTSTSDKNYPNQLSAMKPQSPAKGPLRLVSAHGYPGKLIPSGPVTPMDDTMCYDRVSDNLLRSEVAHVFGEDLYDYIHLVGIILVKVPIMRRVAELQIPLVPLDLVSRGKNVGFQPIHHVITVDLLLTFINKPLHQNSQATESPPAWRPAMSKFTAAAKTKTLLSLIMVSAVAIPRGTQPCLPRDIRGFVKLRIFVTIRRNRVLVLLWVYLKKSLGLNKTSRIAPKQPGIEIDWLSMSILLDLGETYSCHGYQPTFAKSAGKRTSEWLKSAFHIDTAKRSKPSISGEETKHPVAGSGRVNISLPISGPARASTDPQASGHPSNNGCEIYYLNNNPDHLRRCIISEIRQEYEWQALYIIRHDPQAASSSGCPGKLEFWYRSTSSTVNTMVTHTPGGTQKGRANAGVMRRTGVRFGMSTNAARSVSISSTTINHRIIETSPDYRMPEIAPYTRENESGLQGEYHKLLGIADITCLATSVKGLIGRQLSPTFPLLESRQPATCKSAWRDVTGTDPKVAGPIFLGHKIVKGLRNNNSITLRYSRPRNIVSLVEYRKRIETNNLCLGKSKRDQRSDFVAEIHMENRNNIEGSRYSCGNPLGESKMIDGLGEIIPLIRTRGAANLNPGY